MKKKIWIISPLFLVMSATMLIMTGATWFYNNLPLFIVEAVLSVGSIVAVLVSVRVFRAHVGESVKAAQKMLDGGEYQAMDSFTLAVAVVGEAGDVIWVNKAFAASVGSSKECRGENILKFIYPKTVQQIIDGAGTDVTAGDRMFTVFGAATDCGFILYFVDDTYYKEINREFTEKRAVVALASFDNREELARDSSGGEDARLTAEVEAALTHWAQEMGGFLKRLSGGRYLVLTDEVHLRAAREKRFQVLDEVRNVKADERRSATISMGIGRGASSLDEAESWARKALDMALGRGGDQVAVKQKDDTYEFFGGLSKGVEKRDKVRTRVIAATLSDHVRGSDTVLIMGHKFSDLDCLGAAVGLWGAVSRALSTPAYVVVNRQQSLAAPLIDKMEAELGETRMFLSPQEAQGLATAKTLLIIVDTHSQDFVESVELLNAVGRVVVIDHHRMMVKHIDNALVFYHEPYASSASEMVTELVQYISEGNLNRGEAEALLAGVMLDTKNFVLKTGVRTFEAAAYLRRRGADTIEVRRMFADTIETYKAKQEIVAGAEILSGCAIASVDHDIPDIRITAAQAADELLTIQSVVASFVVFPAGGGVSISARSMGDVNVQLVMETLGGGGHLTMAGAQLDGVDVWEGRKLLAQAIRKSYEQNAPKQG